ncbi:uncharacterized protein LOC100900147 [Galendromus occidentalis]|uniref:Uncharacterized protein LOC100900147 n=1 Tax=Galendromus occidentalis TaxID=34638 RepID=A0AAJ6VUQ6_9ACAR|nr:uncharacterized protein LOC100900147 [Galendromus occidentalis]
MYSSKKLPKKMTPQKRAKEFDPGVFHVSGDHLFCSSCNVPVDYMRMSSCRKHLASAVHSRKAEGKVDSNDKKRKLQETVSNMFEKQTDQRMQRRVELMSLVKEFCGANIPLNVIDRPALKSYLEANLSGIGSIPTSRNLRQNYLPKIFELHLKELKTLLRNASSIALVCDETTDPEDRYIFNLLAVDCSESSPSQPGHKLRALLLNSVVLDSTNHKTVSETVLKELYKYEIPLTKISAFVTDNASYMHKTWSSSLRAVLLNAVHVTCTAHLLNLICEIWQSEFKAVNDLVVAIKKGFTACPSRKARFLQYLRAKGGSEALPPVPVSTRWNTWFRAAMYHESHLDDYITFFKEEAEASSSLTVSNIISLSSCRKIEADLTCLKKYAPHLMSILTEYETSSVKAHLLIRELKLLAEWLEISASAENHQSGKTALQRSLVKLNSYISEQPTTRFCQPATRFFNSCQIFDVSYAQIANVDPEVVFDSIPWFDDDTSAKAELKLYLSSTDELSPDGHPVDFWRAAEKRFPKLSRIAISCLSVPVNSVAAERSFSLYSAVLRDDRRSIDEANLPVYNMLYQNSSNI